MNSVAVPGQRGFGVLAAVIVVAAVVVAATVAISAVSAVRVSDARRGWDRSIGSWGEIMRRYPATEANAAALELEGLAAQLGIDIAPRKRVAGARPRRGSSQSFRELNGTVFGLYVVPQLEQSRRGEIDVPPPVFTAYMEKHAAELTAVRGHLIAGPTPRWESDFSKLSDAPLPNLLGHISLHKLLTGLAVARLHEGDFGAALENVEASYRLARSLEDSPTLIGQLILIAETRMQLGVLRHVPDLPRNWIDRMEEHDYRQSFLNAMKYEGWTWLYSDVAMLWGPNEYRWRQRLLAAPVLRPYARLCLADMSDAWRERLINLERVEALCDYDLAAQGANLNIPIPRWNAIGDDLVPSLAKAIDRLARLELDLELTRLIFEADVKRATHEDAWRASAPEFRTSRVCPRDEWVYTAGDGNLHIDFSREIAWPEQRGPVLATRAVLN